MGKSHQLPPTLLSPHITLFNLFTMIFGDHFMFHYLLDTLTISHLLMLTTLGSNFLNINLMC